VLKTHTILLGTVILALLLRSNVAYALTQPPVVPAGFVALTGPHGITVLVGPLRVTSTGGYEREVIIPGEPPFMINTEPGVTPQDIADIYG